MLRLLRWGACLVVCRLERAHPFAAHHHRVQPPPLAYTFRRPRGCTWRKRRLVFTLAPNITKSSLAPIKMRVEVAVIIVGWRLTRAVANTVAHPQ